jgi:hypothetical protein
MEKYNKTPNLLYCEICDYNTYNKSDFNKHKTTRKHISMTNNYTLAIIGNNRLSTNSSNYICSCCNYTTTIKCNYDKHLLTDKHISKINGMPNETTKVKHICCHCNKEYMNYNALWKHKKNCVVINEKDPETIQNTFIPTNVITPELFMEVFRESKELQNVLIEQNKELQNKLLEKENQLLEQNKELQSQILELAKNQQVINNNTTNNTNNNQFNLQIFLNETCKDAMNIVDFVNSLQLTIDDFETTGKLGFVDGISRIFIKELKKLETEKLPIHCTDLKRETVYIKDNDIWEKENNEKQKLKWTIDRIAQLNLNQVQNWQEKYPICIENNTKENEYFFKLAAVALGGKGDDEHDKYRDKIMRNVLREVVLDKKSVVLK